MRAALAAGVAAVVTTTGLLFAATSSAAWQCPPLTQAGSPVTAGPVTVETCTANVKDVKDILVPHCDPGPCDPTAVAPSE
ncbi:MAG TPA: hypothetical protein VGX28_00955 [Frankiaceae bacterium]|jgi:hypothetical protein|nr:hypothetical protein [Frankiaceae bacterium]